MNSNWIRFGSCRSLFARTEAARKYGIIPFPTDSAHKYSCQLLCTRPIKTTLGINTDFFGSYSVKVAAVATESVAAYCGFQLHR